MIDPLSQRTQFWVMLAFVLSLTALALAGTAYLILLTAKGLP